MSAAGERDVQAAAIALSEALRRIALLHGHGHSRDRRQGLTMAALDQAMWGCRPTAADGPTRYWRISSSDLRQASELRLHERDLRDEQGA